jgi:hypothetical protein
MKAIPITARLKSCKCNKQETPLKLAPLVAAIAPVVAGKLMDKIL